MNLKKLKCKEPENVLNAKKAKSIMEGFELRLMDKKTGKIRNQSWCKKCR